MGLGMGLQPKTAKLYERHWRAYPLLVLGCTKVFAKEGVKEPQDEEEDAG